MIGVNVTSVDIAMAALKVDQQQTGKRVQLARRKGHRSGRAVGMGE